MKKKVFITIMMIIVLMTGAVTATGIDVYFSLDDDPEVRIINQIDKARYSLDIALYYFTDREIAQSVVRADDRGVNVRVYLDKSQTSQKYSKSQYLVKHEIPVKISANNDIMHNKFAVIDDQVVLTGSYNWTASAGESNDENLLVIENRSVAEKYSDKFKQFWTTKVDQRLTKKLYATADRQSNVSSDSDNINSGDNKNSDSNILKVVEFNYDADPVWNEFFTIMNITNQSISLNGWKVRDEANHQFTIRNNVELAPGESITIYNYSTKGISLDYKRPLWNNAGDKLYIIDSNHNQRLKYSY